MTPQMEAAVAKAVDFEVTLADLVRRSERRAWRVAWSAVVLALLLGGGYFLFLPLKEKVPYLVMADAYTGTSTIARLSGDFDDPSITTSEALNKSNVSHFILARESYDHSQFGQRDWNTVHAMAAPGVTAAYGRLYAKNSPGNPQALFGKHKAIRIRILSLQLHEPPSTGAAPQSATVRFQRSLHDKGTGATAPLDSKIASVEFVYKPNLRMDEAHRVLNPLGFQVTSYRVDNDYAESPPIAAADEPTFDSATRSRTEAGERPGPNGAQDASASGPMPPRGLEAHPDPEEEAP